MTWPTKKLGEVLELCDSGTWGDESPDGLPLLRSTNMQNGQLILDDLKIIDVPKDKIERYLLREGDILITKSSGSVDHIGKSLYITKEMDGKYGFSNFTQRLRVDQKQVTPEWIYLKISNPATRDFLLGASQTTTGLRNLKIPALKELEIPLPPLEVQKKIVTKLESLLAKVSEAKKLRAEARESADNLLSAELHKIFTEGKNKGWKERELGNVVEVKTTRNTRDDLPYVGMEDVEGGNWNFLGSLEPKKVKSTTFYFDDQSVLYGKLRPYLNKVLLPDFEGHCTTEFMPIYPDKSLQREWLAWWLSSKEIVDRASATSTGSRMPRADLKQVLKFNLPMPPIAEQRKLIKRLEKVSQKVDKVKELQNVTEDEFVALEQAVLSKAFNGELVEEKATAQQSIPSPFYRNQVNAAIIEQVVTDGGSTTEVAVAKYNHLLQEICGVPLGYEFATHKFGSFDPKIKNLIWSGLADRNKWFAKSRGMVVEGQNAGALLARKTNLYWKAKAGMKRLAELGITKLNADKVELLSTVYHSMKQVGSTDLQKVRSFMSNWQTNGNQTKADKFSEERTQKCIDFIVKNELHKKLT